MKTWTTSGGWICEYVSKHTDKGEIPHERVDISMEKTLDKQNKQKEKVVVRITLPSAKAYECCKDTLHDIAERTGASVAVRMI